MISANTPARSPSGRLVAAGLAFAVAAIATLGADPAGQVDPFIGTDGHGHTFPGPTLPFGMVQTGPDTRVLGWDACAGYHYSDRTILGFSHTHLSGVGIPDYGDVLIMPRVPGHDEPAAFSHAREVAEPGYYSVQLDDSGIHVELTTTARVALHRYTFPEDAAGRTITVDLDHRDTVLSSALEVVSATELAGHRHSSAWAPEQRLFFVIQLDTPAAGVTLDRTGRHATIALPDDAPRTVQIKVALSPTGTDGARRNLAAELPAWDFAATRQAARAAWNAALGRISIEGGDEAQRRVFYTALYHAYLCPNLFCDVDGAYLGRDGAIHRADHPYYTIFSLWDTFRAEHPLLTLLEPETTRDFIRTFLLMYQQGGLLPVWDLAGNETFCMNGYHAVAVIADAHAKGIRGFDTALALEAMKHSATRSHFGLGGYQNHGYVGRDDSREGVSRTLEYAYDDWCIGSFAEALGCDADRDTYLRRSQNYQNLFEPESKFFRARENGGWHTPFDEHEINFNYTEGNAWHYRFAVPHDVPRLIALFGGDEPFSRALDALFEAPSDLAGRDQPDVAGLIGQYAHGNEPSHHVAYLYAHAGQPWKTQRRVREIMDTLYTARPDGLCGNEDCGQMSAWYVFSALGFYPVTPGSTQYVLGSPLFDRASIDVGGGRTFTVVARNQAPTHVHIASAALNGAPLARSFLTHDELVRGGELVLTMSDRPNMSWAADPADRPGPRVPDMGIVPAPAVQVPRAFREHVTVEILAFRPDDEVWYSLDGSTPAPGAAGSLRYSAPFRLDAGADIAAVALRGANRSSIVRAETHQFDASLHVRVLSPIHPQYTAGGDSALVDGVTGTDDFTTGRWQGFEDCDLDVIVDLGRSATIDSVSIGFLQDPVSYILFPREVHFEISEDGVAFRPLETVAVEPTPRGTRTSSVRRIATHATARGRFVRIHAPNPGRAVAWGSTELIKSFLFCDEIQVDRH